MKTLAIALLTSTVLSASAGAAHLLVPAKAARPPEPEVQDKPLSSVTIGALFSESATGGYADLLQGLWSSARGDASLFLDERFHLEDTGQRINSLGLGFRKMVPGHDVILGVNAFWDSIHSGEGNDFDQLGLGVEVLTHWVDLRFNYYLPEDERVRIGRREVHHRRGDAVESLTYERFESTLEGLNAEIGFLLPGLDRFFDARIYGGYYHYDNPFGGDFEGFKARLEVRVVPGVIAEIEYWDDAELMGGNWTAGISVSLPFSIYKLVTGRNPFEGAGEMFSTERPFAGRMGEMVRRSHRIQTTTSGRMLTGASESSGSAGIQPQVVRRGRVSFPVE